MSARRTKHAVTTLVVAGVVGAVVAVASISGATPWASSAGGTTTTTAAPTTTEVTTTAAPTTTTTIDDGILRSGKSGPAVLALQQQLTALGYWLGPANGAYGSLTEQAVMAFQKANGLDRDGNAGPTTLAALTHAARLAPAGADGIDIDLARQILMVVQGGQVVWVFNTSTGKPSTPTDPGDFAVTRQVDAMDHAPLGDLWRPKYFNGGDAIHGSTYIPGYAASHGCARVSNGAIDFLWASGLLPIGTPVHVH
jgi:peptidoglycan hydrolase-like protein with peptidoglycan-binding domain